MDLIPTLADTIKELTLSFDDIPSERKKLLEQLAHFIKEKVALNKTVYLVFICTHNSRRSHMAQIWAQAAAAYYTIDNVECYSGGTEATAFYPAAVKAMNMLGFSIMQEKEEKNPTYQIRFSAEQAPFSVWSKRFDDPANPASGFCAVMTCTDADENCPFIPGAEKRLALPYQDPKASDNTATQAKIYEERARQIGREMLYTFSLV